MTNKATKELFLEKTIQAVAQVGMENLRTKMVADYAGFSEATMFRFFPDKDKMLCDTFLEVDRRVSEVFLNGFKPEEFETKSASEILHDSWLRIYSYLITHRDETLYLIRFRYSALYSDEIRAQRMAYNGAFNKPYEYLLKAGLLGKETYRGFLINYLFEMTLCFAEKIVSGRLANSPEMEEQMWKAIYAASEVFIK